ncbi:MAG: glycosyltransferase family 2 protein, partial [Lachnospiraceae bacterium]|nr:glycosyltransferase family 2 protein [Lachnospiraceae bacterium]
MGDKVSIIIPMYKAEEYIRRCIASIEAQTYTNWEAIFVEDGSSDRCGEICEAYAKNDKRIRVIHKKNEGVAVARNIGISNATGEYITFIDSDDYVHAKYLEHLIKLQKKY